MKNVNKMVRNPNTWDDEEDSAEDDLNVDNLLEDPYSLSQRGWSSQRPRGRRGFGFASRTNARRGLRGYGAREPVGNQGSWWGGGQALVADDTATMYAA